MPLPRKSLREEGYKESNISTKQIPLGEGGLRGIDRSQYFPYLQTSFHKHA